MSGVTDHEPHGAHQTRRATASGWIGSALEYYGFPWASRFTTGCGLRQYRPVRLCRHPHNLGVLK